MAEEIVYCSECGRPKRKRWISYSAQMLAGLRLIADYSRRYPGVPMPLRVVSKAFGGTGNAVYQAFHNNRYFGLVAWADGKANGWIITARGEWFLADEHDIPRRVRVYGSQVIEVDPAKIGVTAVPSIQVDYAYALEQMAPATDEDIALSKRLRRRAQEG